MLRSQAELAALPKAELHLHLRGSMPPEYLRERLRKRSPAGALRSAPGEQREWMLRHPGIGRILESRDPARELSGLFKYSNFEQFLAAYLFTAYFVRDVEDFRDLVSGVRRSLRLQSIVYAEVTVSLPEYIQQGLSLEDLLAVLGEEEADEPCIRWIVDPVRNLGPTAAEQLLERLLPMRPPTLVGLTLGGAEHTHPPAPFRRVYQIARASGLRTTVHAGEALGPESVWDALRILKVDRLGHGVRAAEDPSLVRCLAERGVPLEVCPTSNVRTGVYPSLQEHPIRALFEAGVPLTVNTDDPTFFGISLSEELANLRQLGFSWSEIDGLVSNAFRFAFDPQAAVQVRA